MMFSGGSNKRLTVISAYRPNNGIVTSGGETVWRQQYDSITESNLEVSI